MTRISLQLRAQDISTTDEPGMGEATHQRFENDNHDEGTARRPRKRARKAVPTSTGLEQRMPEEFRKVRGKRGLLEKLAKDVPLDVIFEIFYYLEPRDLLRLARSSKNIRGILMSKSSESVWRTCRLNIEGLPPLPEDLNEPQYAHLLFEPYCHLCMHKGRCDNILWTFRIRCCKKCLRTRNIFPLHDDFCSAAELDTQFLAYASSVFPSEEVAGSRRSDIITYTPIAEARIEEYRKVKGDDARKEWFVCMAKRRYAFDEHTRLCQAWHESELDHRADELSEVRSQRKAAILDRLGLIGWREEAELMARCVNDIDQFAIHRLVWPAKKLTDYGWNSIKAELVQFLSDHKQRRLAEERAKISRARYSRFETSYYTLRATMDLREPFPAKGDLLLGKAIEDLVWNTPVDQALTDEAIYSGLFQFSSEMISGWRSRTEQELLNLLQQAVPTATASDLRRATTVFRCGECESPLQYPQMFYHACCMKTPVDVQIATGPMQVYYDGDTTAPKGPWHLGALRYDEKASRLTHDIVEACHLDATRTSVQDLYAANPLTECLACHYKRRTIGFGEEGQSIRSFMRWPLPLLHRHGSADLVTNSFGEDTDLICAAEPTRSFMGHSNIESVHCAHCHKLRTIDSLPHHLKDVHGLTLDPKHWYWSPLCCGGDIRETFRFFTPQPSTVTSEQL